MHHRRPFLPGISAKLPGRSKRSRLDTLTASFNQLRAESISDYGALFDDILPADQLETWSQQKRRRHFPEVITFWAWAGQILEKNVSCARAVTLVQSWSEQAGREAPAFNTSAYCRARQRLSESFLGKVDEQIQGYASQRRTSDQNWCGLRPLALDGTSVQLLDTEENQAAYPQPSAQKAGCGFPAMGVLGVLDLGTGQLVDYFTGPDRTHDSKMAYEVLGNFGQGDVVVGDRAFCSYGLMASLLGRGAHSAMRLHQRREAKIDWRRGRRLSKDSRQVKWEKPPRPAKTPFTEQEWEQMPEALEIRLVRFQTNTRDRKKKTMYVATTLLDTKAYPCEAIAELYGQRWQIEVRFRDIKTTLGLEELRVRTPEMACRMMKLVQIVYNLIKAKQVGAVQGGRTSVHRLGFQATRHVLLEFRSCFRGLLNRPRLLRRNLVRIGRQIATRIVPERPNRQEPRARKKRPKPTALLTAPRSEYQEIQHREHYRKLA